MRVLITGRTGQLGRELLQATPPRWEVTAFSSTELDIRDAGAVQATVAEIGPQVIVNAAAYTAVDKAEKEPGVAYATNSQGVANLAGAAGNAGARLIHISTDFVFDGGKSSPYLSTDTPNPTCVYGASKLAGEEQLQSILPGNYLILRTAWVYSSHGYNFVRTMLRLMRERDQLQVVADQVGTPTWAGGLAQAIWLLAEQAALSGIFHWTDAGVASWYDFAVAIQEEALELGLLDRKTIILPIRTQDYPTPARRPSYSVLDKTATWQALGHSAPHWRVNLRKMLRELLED
jgi:dTDP-4-dehydrorhamnose reductase